MELGLGNKIVPGWVLLLGHFPFHAVRVVAVLADKFSNLGLGEVVPVVIEDHGHREMKEKPWPVLALSS